MNFNKIFSAEKKARSLRIKVFAKEISTPNYFPSVSSIYTYHNIDSVIKLLIQSSYSRMFISAYDIFHRYFNKPRMINKINSYSQDSFLMIDSGGYESFWNKDEKWGAKSYQEVVNRVDSDFYFSFDDTISHGTKDADPLIRGSSKLVSIFHSKYPKKLINKIRGFLTENPLSTNFIAVAERECGLNLVDRAKTILELRRTIDNKGNDQVLHIMGCGHPVSMALYCYCGADSFDSRDWMKVVFDQENYNFRDFSHLDLLKCNCSPCQRTSHPVARVFMHNLGAYDSFLNDLRSKLKMNTLEDFLQLGLKIDLSPFRGV